MSERDKLAELVADYYDNHPDVIADEILASEWLAQHDADLRAAERARIARAIESHAPNPVGLSNSYWLGGMNEAVRIVRTEGIA